MSKLLDFQVYANPTGLADARRVNHALFATYEPVRLWVKEHVVQAPFRKIVVTFSDETISQQWHGNVTNAVGICEVTEAIDLTVLAASVADHRWVLGVVQHALGCIERVVGWRSQELETFIKATLATSLPLVHFFDGLARVDNATSVRCVPWLSTRPDETQVGVRIGDRDVTVLAKPGPLHLEDSFPVAKSAIRGPNYVLLDKAGKALATIAIGIPGER